MTQEQKDIQLIKDDIKSIRVHLDNIKTNQETLKTNKEVAEKKIDLIYNTLTNNEFNGHNGFVTRLNSLEKTVLMHETFWKAFFWLFGSTVFIGLMFKFFIKP